MTFSGDLKRCTDPASPAVEGPDSTTYAKIVYSSNASYANSSPFNYIIPHSRHEQIFHMEANRTMATIDIAKILDSMSIDDKIAQLFLSGLCAEESLDEVRAHMEKDHFGGYSLSYNFARFIRGGSYHDCGIGKLVPIEKTAEWLHKVKELSWEIMGVPVICTLDQEGGMEESEFRRTPVVLTPNQMGIAAIGEEDEAYEAAYLSASQLKALGVDMLLGLCMDVNSNPENVEIAHRALGDLPEVVARLGVRIIHGYHDGGLFCTAKHFPGRGHAGGNAHADLDVLDMDRTHYNEVEFVPFKAAIDAGVDMVMLSHTIYPALGDNKLPASMSPVIIKDVLRKKLDFKGIVYTDDISMLAISKIWGVPTACAMAFEAGNDMILMKVNHELRPAVEATKKFIGEGKITEEQITASAEKVLRLKEKYGMFNRKPFDSAAVTNNVGTEKQLEVGRRLARKAVTALKNEDNIFPLDPQKYTTPLVIACRDRSVSVANDPERSHDMLVNNVQRFYPRARWMILDQAPTKDQIWEIEGQVKNADLVIFAVHTVRSGEASQGQYAKTIEAMEKACSFGKPVVAVVTGAPYVAALFPEAVKGIACSFSVTPPTFEAVVDLMCGKIQMHGKNPVQINDAMPRGHAAPIHIA
ncbi:MAG: hypothetical protein GF344_07715 [Chitinivibrionales bacterium]|nr:hypothetical protein [Chitinivibrionales bacterium]MBD3356786.1 hypothetical protein [Chitinivibrionales bacterium]